MSATQHVRDTRLYGSLQRSALALFRFVAWTAHPAPLIAVLFALPNQVGAQLTTCALVRDSDLVALFRQSAEAKVNPVTGDCIWGNVGIDRRGLTLSISVRDTAITTAGYTHGRELAANNATITDEPHLGDRAYSVVVPYGAMITVLMNGQIVQFRYANGVRGSPNDVDRLRPVAANVVARLRARADSAPVMTRRPE